MCGCTPYGVRLPKQDVPGLCDVFKGGRRYGCGVKPRLGDTRKLCRKTLANEEQIQIAMRQSNKTKVLRRLPKAKVIMAASSKSMKGAPGETGADGRGRM
jgi:hypothetical protein